MRTDPLAFVRRIAARRVARAALAAIDAWDSRAPLRHDLNVCNTGFVVDLLPLRARCAHVARKYIADAARKLAK